MLDRWIIGLALALLAGGWGCTGEDRDRRPEPGVNDDDSAPDDDDTVEPPQAEWSALRYTYQCGECMGYCRRFIELDREGRGRVGYLPWNTEAAHPPLSVEHTLVPAELDSIRTLMNRVLALEWEPVYGCPDCMDQCAVRFEVQTPEGVRQTLIDPMDGPPEAAPLGELLGSWIGRYPVNDEWVCAARGCPTDCADAECEPLTGGECGPHALPADESEPGFCMPIDGGCADDLGCEVWAGPDGYKAASGDAARPEGYLPLQAGFFPTAEIGNAAMLQTNELAQAYYECAGWLPPEETLALDPRRLMGCMQEVYGVNEQWPPLAVLPRCNSGSCELEPMDFTCGGETDCKMIADGACSQLAISASSPIRSLPTRMMCVIGIPACGTCKDGYCVTYREDAGDPDGTCGAP